MNKYIIYLICFLLLITFSSRGQNELNYWYFGRYAGIYFDNSGIHATKGKLITAEGSASISDGCGLLFYTNGDTVWNKTNQMMANGFGLGGQCTNYGDSITSTTQPAIIVRQPLSDSIYYIFTTDCIEDGLVKGLRYSIVNINKNNGYGEVILKNQLLHTPTEEKVTAVRHINGCDIWIITHEWNTNNFYSYLLTSTGLNTTPVISSTGQVHQCYNPLYPDGRGYMKASPNGKKIINVNPDQAYSWCDTTFFPELFSFNNTSGNISSDFTFPKNTSYWWPVFSSWTIPFYCASFSPDNSKLYLGSGWYGPELFQYDLNAGSPSAIIASQVFLSYPFPFPLLYPLKPSALTNAPDGKMYIAQSFKPFLGCINNPNLPGLLCNYVDSAFNLSPETTMDWGGLPNFFEDYLNPKLLKADFAYSQSGNTIYFTNNSIAGSSYSWNFGDGKSSNLKNPSHIYADTGYYTVILTARDDSCNMDKKCYTIHYLSSPINNKDTIIMPNVFTPNNDGSNDNFIPIKNEGITINQISIFNRWGALIHKENSPTILWNGKINNKNASEGIYYWVIEFQNSKGIRKEMRGSVALLR